MTIPEGKTVNIIILDGYKLTINGTLKIAGNESDSASLKLYGTSKAGTGKIVINNPDSSTNNGNAVMSENGKTAYIHLIGGELTATGSGYNAENGTGAALSNVRLLSEVNETVKRTAKVKCVVTDSDPEKKVEDTQKETSVTISRCECADKDWELSRVQEKTMASIGNIVTCAVVYIIGMLQPKDMWTVRLAAVHLFQPVELDIIARVTADVRKPQ